MPPRILSRSSVLPNIWLNDDTNINLDISGVAGFFGGDVAVSAMTTVHLYGARKYLGWYNTPGSYEIARRYGQVARSRFWDGLYPGVNEEPAVFFQLDGLDGPRYRGIRSGTIMRKTGQPAYLLMRQCDVLRPQHWQPPPETRKTSPVDVTVVHLHHIPQQFENLTKEDALATTVITALVPILGSAVTAIMCALSGDWICFAMITLGILSSGISCWIIGTGKLGFYRPQPADGTPPGIGILDDKNHFVVLKGPKDAITAITRGEFTLEYPGSRHFGRLGVGSLLLTIQFLAQLLIVPQGSIFGQVMFLTSLGISWVYNSYLASIDREKLQRRILVKKILGRPVMHRYTLGTRTAMGVFVLLQLASGSTQGHSQLRVGKETPSNDRPGAPSLTDESRMAIRAAARERSLSNERAVMDELSEEEGHDYEEDDGNDHEYAPSARALRVVLDDILPNDTPVWRFWKESLLGQLPSLVRGEPFHRGQPPPTIARRALLQNLYMDVEAAVAAFRAHEALSAV